MRQLFYSMRKVYNIAIVGGGIVGVAHALCAAEAGLRVALFERHAQPVGATIRNFGMIWPIGQPAERMELVLKSRDTWLRMAHATGMWIRDEGSLHVAYHEDEWRVLQEFAESAYEKGYDVSIYSVKQCMERSPGLNPKGLLGGLYSRTELNVDPRQALPLLHKYLSEKHQVDFYYSTAITAIDHPSLTDGKRVWEADRIIVASGADLGTLYPDWHRNGRLIQSKLQMLRTVPQDPGYRLGSNIAAGLTLLHYDAFAACPGVHDLRQRMEVERTEYLKYGIHVMVSATADNALTIGDSHEYGHDFLPFNSTHINELILDYLSTFFQRPKVRIAETWNGVYTKTTDGSMYWAEAPEPGVLLINGLGGAGMTLSFGVADQVISGLD